MFFKTRALYYCGDHCYCRNCQIDNKIKSNEDVENFLDSSSGHFTFLCLSCGWMNVVMKEYDLSSNKTTITVFC